MRDRDCKGNIATYKDELDYLKYIRNPYNVTISHSNIDSQIDKMMRNPLALEYLTKEEAQSRSDFRRLREYLRLSKQRLYCVPRHLLHDPDNDSKGLDFNIYAELRLRHKHDLKGFLSQHQAESGALYARLAGHAPQEEDSPGRESSGLELLIKKNVENREDLHIAREAHRITEKYFKAKKIAPQVRASILKTKSEGVSGFNSTTAAHSRNLPPISLSQTGVESSLSDIFSSCAKVQRDQAKLAKRLKRNRRQLGQDMGRARTILREVTLENEHIQERYKNMTIST